MLEVVAEIVLETVNKLLLVLSINNFSISIDYII